MRKKITDIMEYIYGIGVFLALFAGGVSCIGYVVALIVGGETATNICTFIYKEIYPILFAFASCTALFGLLKMYVAGEKSMVPNKRNNKNNERKTI